MQVSCMEGRQQENLSKFHGDGHLIFNASWLAKCKIALP